MTRDELAIHCVRTVERQHPSTVINKFKINGHTVGDNGDAIILHEHVMPMMMLTRVPLRTLDIRVLRDAAQGTKRHKGRKLFY